MARKRAFNNFLVAFAAVTTIIATSITAEQTGELIHR
jgi:hypothetical protein